MENSEEFKEILTRIRKEMRLTQEAMAEKLGVHVQTIRDYEKGRRRPSIEKLEDIANRLGISSRDLFKGEVDAGAVIPFPMTKVVKMLSSIPDEVYDLAQKVPVNDDIWKTVKISLRIAIETNAKAASKKKKG